MYRFVGISLCVCASVCGPKEPSQSKNVQVRCSKQSAMPSVKSAESEILLGIIRSDSMTSGNSLRSCLLLATILGLLCRTKGEWSVWESGSPSIFGLSSSLSPIALLELWRAVGIKGESVLQPY